MPKKMLKTLPRSSYRTVTCRRKSRQDKPTVFLLLGLLAQEEEEESLIDCP
jgi:hypothetical protein